jgi:hypothetical protein
MIVLKYISANTDKFQNCSVQTHSMLLMSCIFHGTYISLMPCIIFDIITIRLERISETHVLFLILPYREMQNIKNKSRVVLFSMLYLYCNFSINGDSLNNSNSKDTINSGRTLCLITAVDTSVILIQ